MTAEYERYHGIVLRELIVETPSPFLIEVRDEIGRVNSFCLNGQTGLHIKHSAKRLPPWQFTFNEDSLAEIDSLIGSHASFWLALVCGMDGVVALSAAEFRRVTQVDEEAVRFVRVDRDRHTMYRVFGNGGKLQAAKARGVAAIISDALVARAKPKRRGLIDWIGRSQL